MGEENPKYSKSGSPYREVEKIRSEKKEMPSAIALKTITAIARVLFREVGFLKGLWLLARTGTWDAVFSKPMWHPEYFEFKDSAEEEHFRGIFRQLAPMIILYGNLKKAYGEYLAEEISSKMAIPVAVLYIHGSVGTTGKITDISQIRQLFANYLGDGSGFDWTEEVSEDRTEGRYHFTKCAYVMIMQAYGLESYGAYNCLADHVFFDLMTPDIVFSREHAIGVGDDYCDHTVRLLAAGDPGKSDSDYGDCRKARFGGRDAVRHWEEMFKHGG